MSTSIITTKLHIPSVSDKEIIRTDLINKLNDGLNSKLTLISASAGFGKTSILSQWMNICKRPVAWISLDEEHSDISHFLIYLIAALQTIIPGIGTGLSAVLLSPQPPTPRSVLTVLINDIANTGDNLILVLDDYHLVDSSVVDDSLSFLLENLPDQLHMVMATREDPLLPLARYRVRGELNEIRSADLRFSILETTDFFNRELTLNITDEDIVLLEKRTEGWIAGLQLAAISIQGHKDKKGFINSFSGSNRFVLDYLIEEVLSQQTASIQNFLLQTALFDRFCGDLCDAVIQSFPDKSQKTLEIIEQANLFIIPLDEKRKWFRYHHLFAELLIQRLNLNDTVDIPELHRRASVWFEKNGLEIEAFKHAIAANDLDRAEILIEGKGMPLIFRGEMALIHNWLVSLRESVFDKRPSLLVLFAMVLTFLGKGSEAAAKLLTAENVQNELGGVCVQIGRGKGEKRTELSSQQQAAENRGSLSKDLTGQIAAIRAMLAISRNDMKEIEIQSKSALENLNPDNLAVRTITQWTLGLAYQRSGDRVSAIRTFSDVIPISKSSGNIMATIAASTCLGQVLESQNQLHQAEEAYRSIIEEVGVPPWPSVCEAYLGLARISYQKNNLEIAAEYSDLSLSLALQLENIDTPISCWILMAKLKLANKDIKGASALLNKAEQYVRSHSFKHRMNDVISVQIQSLIEQGNLSAAAILIQKNELPSGAVRLSIADGKYPRAIALIDSLLIESETRKWEGERLHFLILQILAFYGDGRTDKTIHLLDELLLLGESSGNIRIFTDEGRIMHRLLSEAISHGRNTDFIKTLVSSFGLIGEEGQNQSLVDPLSRRELEVLELISRGLSNREICEKLFLALDTVKGHNRKIFSKLGVNNRTRAIRKARSINIL